MEVLLFILSLIALPFVLIGGVLHLVGAAIAFPFRILALPFKLLGLVLGLVLGVIGLVLGLLFGAFGLGIGVLGLVGILLAIPLLPILAIIFLWRALRRRQPTPGGTHQWGMW